MAGMSSLKVAQQLSATINQLYEETVSRLEGAFQSVCTDFRPDQFLKVIHSDECMLCEFTHVILSLCLWLGTELLQAGCWDAWVGELVNK